MAKVFEKAKEFLGFNVDQDEYEEEDYNEFDDAELEDSEEEEYGSMLKTSSHVASTKNANKVVSIHSAASPSIVIKKPTSYDDSLGICNELRNRKIVIINTTALETKVARRLLDFVSGASYAVDGNLDEVENRVYILTPSNVTVTNELKTELSSKGIFNWK